MEQLTGNWSTAKKIAFRFFFVYFVLYVTGLFFEELTAPLVMLAGKLLHVPSKRLGLPSNGSGDTTFHYLEALALLTVSFPITMIWSVADRKRKNYVTLSYWFRVGLRYTLGMFMVSYGFAKIFMTQFQHPTLIQLVQPLGNSSPMGLAWKFMGYSYGFNFFTGLAEAIGGLLLLPRRTTTFGALFSMTVLTNVVAMNLCFDIPVKLFSMHLLLMAIAIAVPDLNRLVSLFLRNCSIAAAQEHPLPAKKWMRVSRVVLKTLALIAIAGMPVMDYYEAKGTLADEPTPLYGIYDVKEFSQDSVLLPPLATDSTRWKQLIIDKGGYAVVKTMTDKQQHFDVDVDTVKRTIKLKNIRTSDSTVIAYEVVDSNQTVLSGNLFPHPVRMTLKKKKLTDFLLVSRGFNWVNEYPYNR